MNIGVAAGIRCAGHCCTLVTCTGSVYFSFTPRHEAMRIMSSGEACFLRWSSTLRRIVTVSHSELIWIPHIWIEPFSAIEIARFFQACFMTLMFGLPLPRVYVPSVHVIVCLVRRRYESTVFLASSGKKHFIYLPAYQSIERLLMVNKG